MSIKLASKWWLLLSVILWLPVNTISAPARGTEQPPILIVGAEGYQTDDHEVILIIKLRNKDTLSDGMIAYLQPQDLLLPL
ncbi:hypothetical protein TI03_03145, partial [Achromatium sp. WMS1]